MPLSHVLREHLRHEPRRTGGRRNVCLALADVDVLNDGGECDGEAPGGGLIFNGRYGSGMAGECSALASRCMGKVVPKPPCD